MGDSFYHIFATLYLLFVRTIKSRNFTFVNKLRKNRRLFVTSQSKRGGTERQVTLCGVEIHSVISKIYVMGDIHGIKE